MKNKSGDTNSRKDSWLETADDEFEQNFYGDESDIPAEPETDQAEETAKPSGEAEPVRDDDERHLEVPTGDKKKWILFGMIAICLIALLAFFFSDRFFNMIRGRSSYTLEKTEQQVTFQEGNTRVLLAGSTLLRCNQDGVQALGEKGEVKWDVPFTMSAPYMLKAGNYVCVADRLGTLVLLIQDGIIQTEITTEKNILLHCVNAKGSSAVVLDGGDSHSVILYSADGDILMQRFTYANTDGIPVAITLSDDGSRMATSYIYYTGSRMQSIVTVFDLTESGSSLVDRIVGSVSFEDCLISDLRFNEDQCFYTGTDRLGVISAGESCEILWEKTLEYQIEALAMTDTYFAVRYGDGLAGTVVPVENNIAVYDYSGDALFETNVDGADYLDAWGDTVIIGSGRSYYGYSFSGSPKWQMDSIEDYSRLIAFESGDTVAALRNGQIDYYRVVIKSAAEDAANE